MNKKHKIVKNSAKISIFIRLSKYSKSIVPILNLLKIIIKKDQFPLVVKRNKAKRWVKEVFKKNKLANIKKY